MIKFWKADFSYEKRLGCSEPFGWLFCVRGESANYLMNRYGLSYPRVFVNCYPYETIYIGSRRYDDMQSDCCECEDDDMEELFEVLKPIIDADMVNYEEKICND